MGKRLFSGIVTKGVELNFAVSLKEFPTEYGVMAGELGLAYEITIGPDREVGHDCSEHVGQMMDQFTMELQDKDSTEAERDLAVELQFI